MKSELTVKDGPAVDIVQKYVEEEEKDREKKLHMALQVRTRLAGVIEQRPTHVLAHASTYTPTHAYTHLNTHIHILTISMQLYRQICRTRGAH